jgi:DnaJ-class molecular chaperone
MRDPYQVLGVARTATADEIRQAYRKIAKASHPDLHPGEAKAEARFKEASSAYDLLSDADRRARFDRGEIDAAGNERHQGFRPRGGAGSYRGFADGPGGAKYRTTGDIFGEEADLESVFADLFGAGGLRGGRAGGAGRRGDGGRARGADASFTLEIDLPEAARGGRQTVQLPDGRRLEVAIPPGTTDGKVLRLAGMGSPGLGGGPAGDAYVEVKVRPHPVFQLKGDGDVHVELPVTLAEAVLGGRVTVPTLGGPVAMTIPKGSNTGSTLRLKGKGMPARDGRPAGDQYVRLKVVLPRAELGADLADAIRRHEEAHPYDPRAELMREAGT